MPGFSCNTYSSLNNFREEIIGIELSRVKTKAGATVTGMNGKTQNRRGTGFSVVFSAGRRALKVHYFPSFVSL